VSVKTVRRLQRSNLILFPPRNGERGVVRQIKRCCNVKMRIRKIADLLSSCGKLPFAETFPPDFLQYKSQFKQKELKL
jgi:hypothetical protein